MHTGKLGLYRLSSMQTGVRAKVDEVMLWRRLPAQCPAGPHLLSEIVASLGLVLVIFALARSGRSRSTPAAVGAYIGAAYFFTSSTSFANPAITVGRMFSDTFAGIAPASASAFIAAEVIGGALAVVLIRALYPGLTQAQAERILVPHAAAGGTRTSRAPSAGTAGQTGELGQSASNPPA